MRFTRSVEFLSLRGDLAAADTAESFFKKQNDNM